MPEKIQKEKKTRLKNYDFKSENWNKLSQVFLGSKSSQWHLSKLHSGKIRDIESWIWDSSGADYVMTRLILAAAFGRFTKGIPYAVYNKWRKLADRMTREQIRAKKRLNG